MDDKESSFNEKVKESISGMDGIEVIRGISPSSIHVRRYGEDFLVQTKQAEKYKRVTPSPEDFRKFLKEKNCTQDHAAELCGISRNVMRKYCADRLASNAQILPYSVWFTVHVELTGRKPYEPANDAGSDNATMIKGLNLPELSYSAKFRKMQIGDCFLVQENEKRNIWSAKHHYRKKCPGFNCYVAKIEEGEHAGKLACFRSA